MTTINHLLILLLTAAAGPASTPVPAAERRGVVMGTQFTINVQASHREVALQASEAALEAFHRTEKRLSTWTEQSELSQFVGDELTIKLDPALYNDVYLYQREYVKRFALILFVPFNYYSSDTRYDRLAVVFDEHDKVAAVGWTPVDWDDD